MSISPRPVAVSILASDNFCESTRVLSCKYFFASIQNEHGLRARSWPLTIDLAYVHFYDGYVIIKLSYIVVNVLRVTNMERSTSVSTNSWQLAQREICCGMNNWCNTRHQKSKKQDSIHIEVSWLSRKPHPLCGGCGFANWFERVSTYQIDCIRMCDLFLLRVLWTLRSKLPKYSIMRYYHRAKLIWFLLLIMTWKTEGMVIKW